LDLVSSDAVAPHN